MYERFSDRARQILQFANDEARRMNHEYLGTEHLLVGLIKEGTGIAANVLFNLDVSLREVHERIAAIMLPGPEPVRTIKLPQTPRVKRVIEYAIEEARDLNHNYVGSEHLLLGMVRENEGLAGQVLAEFGVKLNVLRRQIQCLLGHPASKIQLERSAEEYAAIVGHIKKICANTLPAKKAFLCAALAVQVFNKSVPPDADPPLVIDGSP